MYMLCCLHRHIRNRGTISWFILDCIASNGVLDAKSFKKIKLNLNDVEMYALLCNIYTVRYCKI
jgi:hypothetical protein